MHQYDLLLALNALPVSSSSNLFQSEATTQAHSTFVSHYKWPFHLCQEARLVQFLQESSCLLDLCKVILNITKEGWYFLLTTASFLRCFYSWELGNQHGHHTKALFGRAPAPCKKGGAGASGAGFCGSTGSTSSQAKPQLHLLTCYSMELLHLLSVC